MAVQRAEHDGVVALRGVPEIRPRVVHVGVHPRVRVWLLEVQRPAHVEDDRIDLHRVDVLGARQKQIGHVVARARPDYQDRVGLRNQGEGAEVIIAHAAGEAFGRVVHRLHVDHVLVKRAVHEQHVAVERTQDVDAIVRRPVLRLRSRGHERGTHDQSCREPQGRRKPPCIERQHQPHQKAECKPQRGRRAEP